MDPKKSGIPWQSSGCRFPGQEPELARREQAGYGEGTQDAKQVLVQHFHGSRLLYHGHRLTDPSSPFSSPVSDSRLLLMLKDQWHTLSNVLR